MIYKPKYFKLYELLPRQLYYALQDEEEILCWYMFDYRILVSIDRIRGRYGKMIANTWYWGGSKQYRGWRPWDCKDGARLSQHKFGRAVDLVPREVTAEEIRRDIKDDPWNNIFYYINCIEDDVWWLHVDVRNWAKYKSGLLVIKP